MYQDVLCRRYYEEHVVAIFAQQMQSEYYGGNISAYIEGILLEHFSATDQETPSQYLHSHTLHALFNLFLSDHSKQDTDTTAVHNKLIMELLKDIFKLLVSVLYWRI